MLRACETKFEKTIWLDTRHIVAIYERDDGSTGVTLSTGIGNEWRFTKTPAQLASHLQEPG